MKEQPKDEPSAYDKLPPKHRRYVDEYFLSGMVQTKAYLAAGYGGKEPPEEDEEAHRKWEQNVRSNASRLTTSDNVAEAIRERMAKLTMSADEVLYRLNEEATATADDFIRFVPAIERPRILRPVRELLRELEERIRFEEEYEAAAELSEKEKEGHAAEIRYLERQAVRYRLILKRNPEAAEEAPGEPAEVLEPVADLARAKRRGKLHLVKALKRDRNGNLVVELHDAQAAKKLIGQHHKLFTERHEHTGPGGGPVQISEVTDLDRLERLEALRRRVEEAPGDSDS